MPVSPARVRSGPPKFYFFLLPQGGAPEATRYQHPAIALGEGFAALGIPFASNVDQWPPSPSALPLFRADPAVDPHSCSAVILTSDWLEEGRAIPPGLFERPDRPLTVYLDHEDGSRIRSLRPGFPPFDLVLRAHYGAYTPYPSSFRPWAFGLTNRIIESTAPRQPAQDRIRRLLVSYRHTRFTHAMRTYMDRKFLGQLEGRLPIVRYVEEARTVWEDPLAEHLWRLTGRRHSSGYFKALRESVASACFGGYFITRWPRDERSAISRLMKRAITRLHLRTRRITQFDSWRFWESLAAGCATVHLDLQKYGAVLPVMPRNWEHYIGLDLSNLKEQIDRIVEDPALLSRIGEAGRAWSIDTYAPRQTASRFLALLGFAAPAIRC